MPSLDMDGLSFEAYRDKVLRGEVPWDTYVTAKLITGTDFQLLRRYDHRSKEIQAVLLEENGAAYVHTFVSVLRNVFKEETVEYTIALIDDLLSSDKKRAHLFHSSTFTDDVYAPFVRLLNHKNWFVLEATARILPLVVVSRPHKRASIAASSSSSSSHPAGDIDHVLEPFIAWLTGQLVHPSNPPRSVPVAITALATLLRDSSPRSLFVRADGVRLIARFIVPVTSQQQMQLLYESVLCVWLLSFHDDAIEAIKAARLLPQIIDIVRSTVKEKIVRVAVLTLGNLMGRGHMGAAMVELGLSKTVQSLKMQTWHDEDLKEALEALDTGLRHNLRVMSSFDKYKQEVLSGAMDWTPMHKDPAFWRENVMHFEDNDFQVLRALVALLDSPEPRTLAVACQDIGQFIASHPSGRSVALDMKAKDKVLRLLDHPDAEVRKQALLAVQKLLLSAKYVSYLQ